MSDKIIILGDLHFGARNCNEAVMYHQKKFFNFLFDYMKSNGITEIFQLGDTWDSRRNINFKALDFAYREFFDVMKDKGLNYHTLIGNHDIFYREALDIHSPRLLLRNYPNVKLYDEPCVVKFGNASFDVIPWICEENREKCMDFIKNSLEEYCFGHFEINAFEVVPGIEFSTGLNPSEFSNYKKVFSGHFHQRSEKENIWYVGTPYELTWSDTYRSKGFVVFDTKTKETTFVENPSPYFVNLTYDDKDNTTTKIDDMVLENCFIKLTIKNKTEPFSYNKFVAKLYEKNPADVKFIETSVTDDDASIEINVNDLKMEDIITKYVDEKTTFGDKTSLKSFLLGLYNEAQVQSSKDLL